MKWWWFWMDSDCECVVFSLSNDPCPNIFLPCMLCMNNAQVLNAFLEISGQDVVESVERIPLTAVELNHYLVWKPSSCTLMAWPRKSPEMTSRAERTLSENHSNESQGKSQSVHGEMKGAQFNFLQCCTAMWLDEWLELLHIPGRTTFGCTTFNLQHFRTHWKARRKTSKNGSRECPPRWWLSAVGSLLESWYNNIIWHQQRNVHTITSFHITGLTLVGSWGPAVNCSHDFVQSHSLTQRASSRILQVVPNLWMNLHKLRNSYMLMPYERLQQSIEIQSHTHTHTLGTYCWHNISMYYEQIHPWENLLPGHFFCSMLYPPINAQEILNARRSVEAWPVPTDLMLEARHFCPTSLQL